MNLTRLELFEEWLEKHPKLDSIYCFFKYTVYERGLREWYYQVQFFFQRIFKGYSDDELWNVSFRIYKTAFRLIVPFKKELLRQIELGEKGGYGIPWGMSDKRWLYIIDEIIFFLDETINGNNYPYPQYDYKRVELKNKKGYILKELGTKKQIKEQKEKVDAYNKRLIQGEKLFHKHLKNLWE